MNNSYSYPHICGVYPQIVTYFNKVRGQHVYLFIAEK